MFRTKSPEEHVAKEAAKAHALAEHQRKEFLATPVGQARAAFERGDRVFQYSHAVTSQQAVIVSMVGSSVATKTSDPSAILNAVCAEGWDVVNGSFVFVEQGQQSRDKFMSSGQNVAVKGETIGYYLFRRCEASHQTV